MYRLSSVSIAIAVVLSGCASVDVLPVKSPDQPGIRYWRPAPYIALSPTINAGVTTCDAKLIMLPDKTQEYAITIDPGIGTAEASPTLQDGWNLTGLTGKADSKTAENIGAIANLIGNVGKSVAFNANPPQPGQTDSAQQSVLKNCTGLIKIVYDPRTGEQSFKRVSLGVNFALQPPAAAPKPKGPGDDAGKKKLSGGTFSMEPEASSRRPTAAHDTEPTPGP